MWVLAVCLSGLSGFQLGLLQSLFKAFGYIAGGLLGVFLAFNYLGNHYPKSIKLTLTLILILLTGLLSEFLLVRVGLLLHKGLLFAPFKLLDALFGALFAALKNLVLIYLVATVLVATSWQMPSDYIVRSYIYSYLDKHLPKIFTDLKGEVDKLT